MKLNPVLAGLLIALAFWAGRWSSSNPSATPANLATAGTGGGGQHPLAAGALVNQLRSAQDTPVLPTQAKSAMPPDLVEPPMLPDTPSEVRNTGPFIDADPDKFSAQLLGPDQPVRNTGAFVDAGGPPYAHHEEAAGGWRGTKPRQ